MRECCAQHAKRGMTYLKRNRFYWNSCGRARDGSTAEGGVIARQVGAGLQRVGGSSPLPQKEASAGSSSRGGGRMKRSARWGGDGRGFDFAGDRHSREHRSESEDLVPGGTLRGSTFVLTQCKCYGLWLQLYRSLLKYELGESMNHASWHDNQVMLVSWRVPAGG